MKSLRKLDRLLTSAAQVQGNQIAELEHVDQQIDLLLRSALHEEQPPLALRLALQKPADHFAGWTSSSDGWQERAANPAEVLADQNSTNRRGKFCDLDGAAPGQQDFRRFNFEE